MPNNVFLLTLLILEYYKSMLKIIAKLIYFFEIKKIFKKFYLSLHK